MPPVNPEVEHSGLISFRMTWFDLLEVQGTLKESSPALQFKSISTLLLSLLYCPTLTSVHVETTGKTIASYVITNLILLTIL